MNDLEDRVRQWREELEATLAFEPDELDELEDHLRSAYNSGLAENLAPEIAWQRALSRLGPASTLAVEFTKKKLLPSLLQLLKTWWMPGLLLILFCLKFNSSYSWAWPTMVDQSSPTYSFWIGIWLSLVATLALLPGKPAKNGVLLGTGNAFFMIPLLYFAFYNTWTEQFIGPGWIGMSAHFGWQPITLGLTGIVVLNLWAWKRGFPASGDQTTALPIAGVIVFLLAVSPFISELIGNLSMRDMYNMPTAQEVLYTGETKNDFIKWKFVDVLLKSLTMIVIWLPPILLIMFSAGTLAVRAYIPSQKAVNTEPFSTFPSAPELPWTMGLAASGITWVWAQAIEPPLAQKILTVDAGANHVDTIHFGPAFLVLIPALLFILCGYELTRRLHRAESIRPFYASMLAAGTAVIFLGLAIWPALWFEDHFSASSKNDRPFGPVAIPFFFIPLAAGIALAQSWLIAKKIRTVSCRPSLWKFTGGDLVKFGLLSGLISTCVSTILIMVALVLAFTSVEVIAAMIAWGQFISDPLKNHYDPTLHYRPEASANLGFPSSHLDFWLFGGLTFLSFCTTLGLLAAIVLSGLEFLRFNIYRLYKVRQIRLAAANVPAPALND